MPRSGDPPAGPVGELEKPKSRWRLPPFKPWHVLVWVTVINATLFTLLVLVAFITKWLS
jgi:hypothetical protein